MNSPEPAQPWQQQPPTAPGPIGPPPPKRGPSLPTAIIAAAVLLGAALIAAAIVFASGNKTQPLVIAPSTTAQAAAVATESTATCKAWRTTSIELEAVPPLPDGVDFNTPNIDTLVANQKAAIDKALDAFEPKIVANDPPQVVSAAKAYISAKRTDLAKMTAHTVTEADDTAVDTALATLKQLCAS